MLKIGLTGGVASGKSAAARLFAELGAQIIDTDLIARDVVAPGTSGLQQLTRAFGADVLSPAGELDRAAMRARIFSQPALRQQLEAILHPLIRAGALEEAKTVTGPYQIMVVPLLLETGFDKLVDRVLVIDCPEKLQQERLATRDKIEAGLVRQMLAAQTDRTTRLQGADDVIVNDGSPEQLANAVRILHQQYLQLAHTDS